MKKLILLGLMGFLLTSCGANPAPTNTPEQTKAPQAASEPAMPGAMPVAQGTYENDLKSISSKIKDSNEFKGCMDMQVPMCIQSAGMQIAQRTKSPEFCNELTRESDKEGCIFAVTMLNAQEKNDITLCKSLSANYATQCANNIVRTQATSKKDPKLCDNLITQSGSLNEKDMCIMNVVMSNSESTKADCDTIGDANMKKSCEDMIQTRPTMTAPVVPVAPTPTPPKQ